MLGLLYCQSVQISRHVLAGSDTGSIQTARMQPQPKVAACIWSCTVDMSGIQIQPLDIQDAELQEALDVQPLMRNCIATVDSIRQ